MSRSNLVSGSSSYEKPVFRETGWSQQDTDSAESDEIEPQSKSVRKKLADHKTEKKNATTACQACRRLRRKCTGVKPCHNCIKAKVDCVFDQQPDRRHKVHKEMVSQQLNDRSKLLDRLVNAIRTASAPQLGTFLEDVRSGDDRAINHLIRQVNQRSQWWSDAAQVQSKASIAATTTTSPGTNDDDPKSTSPFLLSGNSKHNSGYAIENHNVSVVDASMLVQNLSNHQNSFLRGSNSVVNHFGNLPMSYAIVANNYPQDVQARQLRYFRQQEHSIPSLQIHSDSEDPNQFRKVISSFHRAALQLIADGTPIDLVIGRGQVDIAPLLRNKSAPGGFSTDAFACDLARQILPTDGPYSMFAAMAFATGVALLMRWQLLPTAEHYEQIPLMVRPLPVQRLVPHFPDVDLCIHPASRRCLIFRYREYNEALRLSKPRIDWAGTFEEAIVKDPATEAIYLSKSFEERAFIPEKWTWHRSVLQVFPEAEEMGAVMRDY